MALLEIADLSVNYGEIEALRGVSFTIDHTLINSDAVRIEMESGTVYLVSESIDEIEAMMEMVEDKNV